MDSWSDIKKLGVLKYLRRKWLALSYPKPTDKIWRVGGVWGNCISLLSNGKDGKSEWLVFGLRQPVVGDALLAPMESGKMALLLVIKKDYDRCFHKHTITTVYWRHAEPDEQFVFAS